MLEWEVHPFVENKVKSTLLVLFIFIICVIIYIKLRHPWYVIFFALLLIGSLHTYFFRTKYKFSDTDITINYPLYTIKREWNYYRGYYIDKNGILLTPFSVPNRLENFRGVFIKYDKNKKDEIIAYIRSKISNEISIKRGG